MKTILAALLLALPAAARASGDLFVDPAQVQGLLIQAQAALPPKPLTKDLQYQDSVERRAAAVQAYRAALPKVVERAVRQSGPWAVVLDVDDTVLDHRQYQYESEGVFDFKTWDAWVRREEAVAVPGAKEFLDVVRALPGAHVVFITDRNTDQDEATISNLRKRGLYSDSDLLLSRADRDDNKGARRRCVLEARDPRCAARGPMPILALLGDSLRDFAELYDTDLSDPQAREAVVRDPRWGEEWFVIPNPMYGQWQRGYKK